MDNPDLPEPLRARLAERQARPSVEKLRSFLHVYVEDSLDLDEVRDEIRQTAQDDTSQLRNDLAALEAVLAEPHEPGTLLRLVEGDGNWGLDHDQTDAGAAAFLRELAQTLRSVIDEVR
jgi:hypothetical protein